MSKLKPLARKSDIVVQEMDKEILIYDLQTNKAYNLNETSSIIWQLADGNKTITEIADKLTHKFNSQVTDDFVWLALEQLRKDKLVENETEIAGFFEGVSRREMIRKVGLASLIALPIVSSLVAPNAVNAQSCTTATTGRALGCPCTAAGNCTSGCCGATASGTANQSCVQTGLEATGSFCRAACECVSNCCVGSACQDGEIPSGMGTCVTACQCASNSCNTVTGICN